MIELLTVLCMEKGITMPTFVSNRQITRSLHEGGLDAVVHQARHVAAAVFGDSSLEAVLVAELRI